MIPSLLRNIDPLQDSFGTKLTIIQQWISKACSNAGIPISMSTPLLRDIDPLRDTEGTKLAIIQRWLTALSGGLSPVAGGAQAGSVAVATNATSQAIVFATPFAAAPSVVCNLVPPNGGAPILVNPTNITTTGFTGDWGFPIDAGYKFAWQAVPITQ